MPIASPSSAQAGFLLPGPGLFRFQFGITGQGWGQGYWQSSGPTEGQALDDFFHDLVAGITGLNPTLVRPRWQEEPPNYPADVDWCAVGVTEANPDPGWAYVFHDGAASGRDYVQHHETLTLMVSFYGKNADQYEGFLRDGLQASQNREVLQLTAMGLIDFGPRTIAPLFLGEKWHRRVDRRYRFHRLIREVYPVLNILSVAVSASMQEQSGRLNSVTRSVTSPSTT